MNGRSRPDIGFPEMFDGATHTHVLIAASDQEFGPALELPLGLSWIGQDEAAKCSGRTAWGVNNISNAAGRLLTQIDFVAPAGSRKS